MKCPGQDSRYWDSGSIYEVECPKCGNIDEFFKDESTRKCRKCGYRVVNPKMDFGCASYCKFADQCIGELPPEILAEKEILLKNRVGIQMRMYFGSDYKRIEHANKVAEYAEKIAREEKADLAVVLSAAYLHDIGIRESEYKYNSTASEYQEQEGPPIAREILEKLGTAPDVINEVCDIIGRHHHPSENENINFKSVFDADQIVNLEENIKTELKKIIMEKNKIKSVLNKILLTDSGRKLAADILNQQN